MIEFCRLVSCISHTSESIYIYIYYFSKIFQISIRSLWKKNHTNIMVCIFLESWSMHTILGERNEQQIN